MKCVAILLGITAALFAETQTERGKRVVDEAIAALGGEKFLAIEDRIEEGRAYSFYREQLTGLARAKIYTRYAQPVKSGTQAVAQRERHSFGKDEDYLMLFLEDKGYQVTFRGAKPLEEERWARYLESTRKNFFYIVRQRLNEPGLIIESRGADVWSNIPVETVDITDADNNVVTVYFNRATKLPVRQMYVHRDPKTKERDEYSTLWAKYRDVGGVQWPYHIRSERNGQKTFEMFSDAVTVNQKLPEAMFSLDARLRVLPADK